jgi:hypothetical protein
VASQLWRRDLPPSIRRRRRHRPNRHTPCQLGYLHLRPLCRYTHRIHCHCKPDILLFWFPSLFPFCFRLPAASGRERRIFLGLLLLTKATLISHVINQCCVIVTSRGHKFYRQELKCTLRTIRQHLHHALHILMIPPTPIPIQVILTLIRAILTLIRAIPTQIPATLIPGILRIHVTDAV